MVSWCSLSSRWWSTWPLASTLLANYSIILRDFNKWELRYISYMHSNVCYHMQNAVRVHSMRPSFHQNNDSNFLEVNSRYIPISCFRCRRCDIQWKALNFWQAYTCNPTLTASHHGRMLHNPDQNMHKRPLVNDSYDEDSTDIIRVCNF
jgi:hypothetical protein